MKPITPYTIVKAYLLVLVSALIVLLCIAHNKAYAMDTTGFNTITLTKESSPAPYCRVTKISDNNKCMDCHILKEVDGEPVFGLKEIPKDAGYNLPDKTKLWSHKNDDGTHGLSLYFQNEGTSSSVLRSISKYMYDHPEFTRFIMEVDSPGGSVMDAWRGSGILEEMRCRGIEIETRCYGFAASAGTLLLIAGDQGRRFVNPHAEIMLHKLWTFAMFKIDDPDTSEDQAELMRHFQDNINDFIMTRTGLTRDMLDEEMYKKDWWITGQEAMDLGVVDGRIK